MPEIIITKGDFRLEINLRELLDTFDGVTTVEKADIPVEVEPEPVNTTPSRTVRRPRAIKATEPVVEVVEEVELVEDTVEDSTPVAGITTKEELIKWFMTVDIDLAKLRDDILPKYNIKRVSDIPDEQVVEFYNALVAILI